MRYIVILLGFVLTTAYALFVVTLVARTGCGVSRPPASKEHPVTETAPTPEQVYNDRTARQWVEHFADAKHSPKNDARGVAALIAIAQNEPPKLRAWALRMLGDVGPAQPNVMSVILVGLEDTDQEVRAAAVEAVRVNGTVVLPLIIDRVRKNTAPSAAGKALGKIGAPAIPPLLALLPEATDSTRVSVFSALEHFDASVIPLLLAAHNHESPRVAEAVEHAVRHIPMAVSPLRKALTDTNSDIRRAAARGLGQQLTAWAKEPPTELKAILADPDVRVRTAAVEALARIEPRSAAVFDLLAAARADLKPGVRAEAYGASRLIKELPNAQAVMLEGMADGSSEVRAQAVRGLSGSTHLLKAIEDPVPYIRQLAVSKLSRTGDTASILKGLLPALKDTNQEVRESAILELATSAVPTDGEQRRVVVSALVAVFEDPNSGAQQSIANLLSTNLQPESLTSIPVFVKALDGAHYGSALHALGYFREAAVPALAEVLAVQDITRRRNAAEALRDISRRSDGRVKAALPALRKAASDPDPTLRDRAAAALGYVRGETPSR